LLYRTVTNNKMDVEDLAPSFDVDERIKKIEIERKSALRRTRVMVLVVVIVMGLWNLFQNICQLLGLLDGQIGAWMTGISIVLGFLNGAFEIVVRWRLPMLEGPSEHLQQIKRQIDAIRPMIMRYTEIAHPLPSTAVEGKMIKECLDKLCSQLTYSGSMHRVVASAPV